MRISLLLAISEEVGVYMASTRDGRMLFVTGHPEYDRDIEKGAPLLREVSHQLSLREDVSLERRNDCPLVGA